MNKRSYLVTFAMALLMIVPAAFAQNPVKFEVQMNVQVQSTLFNINTDSVEVRGSFNGWSGFTGLMTKDANDTIYTVTMALPDSLIGDTLGYKFVETHNGGDNWESTVPANAIGGNRWFVLVSGGQQVGPYYFNQDSVVGASANWTFQVNMSEMEQTGYFQPDSGDFVDLRGDIIPGGWGPGTKMTENPLNPGHYSATVHLIAPVGSQFGQKYFINTTRTAFPLPPNGGWEEGPHGANYEYTFTGKDSTLPERFFDDITGVLKTPVTVVLSVDMHGAKNAVTGQPFPANDSVFVGGSEPPLSWLYGQAWADTMHSLRLYDDGTHGDLVAGDSIYSGTFTFPKGSVNKLWVMYSAFVLSGGLIEQNEQNTSNNFDNHQIWLPDSTGPGQVVRYQANMFGDYLDSVTVVTGISRLPNVMPTVFSLDQNYPNPFNPSTVIRYSVPKNSQVSLRIYNVLGQEVATLYNGMQQAGTYEYRFNASRLASGVYFYSLHAGSFSAVKKMLLLK